MEAVVSQKLYCYVDESGQDTKGKFFVVSAVVFDEKRDEAYSVIEVLERESGKGKSKWIKTAKAARITFMDAVISNSVFHGCLNYAIYRNSTEYLLHTARTTQRAILGRAQPDHKATIIVDGLEGSQEQLFRNLIRGGGVRHKTIRGLRDEADAGIRLADMLCGFVRAALLPPREPYATMLQRAKAKNCILEL